MESSDLDKFSWLEDTFSDPIRELCHLPRDELLNLAIQVLHIPADQRREIHQQTLKIALQGIGFFAKLIHEHGERVFDQCLSRLTHLQVPAGEAVCKVGDPGSTFYVVLKGDLSVSVMVQKVVELKATKKRHARRVIRHELQQVNILNPGAYFGELALIQDAPRTATIRAMEQVHLAVLARDAFKEVLTQHALWQIERDIGFFKSLPIFSKSSKRAISTLIYHFKLTKLSRNTVIFKEDEESTRLYIVKSGEVKISKVLSVKQEIAFDEVGPPRSIKKLFELAILGPKEIFGAEELYCQTRRETSASVSSNEAEIYYISKKDFERRLAESEEFNIYFVDYCQQKVEARKERIQMILENVPMQGTLKKSNKSLLKKRNITPQPSRRHSPSGEKRREKSPKQEVREKPRAASNPRPNVKAITELREITASPIHFTSYNPLASSPHNSPILTTKNHEGSPDHSPTLAPLINNMKKHYSRQIDSDWARIKTQSPFELNNTSRLFENKIFEKNTSKIRQSLGRNERKKTEIGEQPTRNHISTRCTEPKEGFEYHKSIIEAQSKILKNQLRGKEPINEEAVFADLFKEQTPLKRRLTPVLNQVQKSTNFDLFDRYKNLPIFHLETSKMVKDPYEVRNIHVQAKKMTNNNESFRVQAKIYHRVQLSASQNISREELRSRMTRGSQDQLIFIDVTHAGSRLLNQNSSLMEDESPVPSPRQTKFRSQPNTRKNSLSRVLDMRIINKNIC